MTLSLFQCNYAIFAVMGEVTEARRLSKRNLMKKNPGLLPSLPNLKNNFAIARGINNLNRVTRLGEISQIWLLIKGKIWHVKCVLSIQKAFVEDVLDFKIEL